MKAPSTTSWHEANQRYLMRAVEALRDALMRKGGIDSAASHKPPAEPPAAPSAAPDDMEPPPALETVCAAFGLSPFEREILLLCAGVELSADFARLVSSIHGDPRRVLPTFGLALASLTEPHWSALSPVGPLRRWRLIETGSGERLTGTPLRIDERVLHYLTGISYLDERLSAMVEAVPAPAELPPSQQRQAEKVVGAWSAAAKGGMPAVLLCGDGVQPKRAVAAAAAAALGLRLFSISAQVLPQQPAELDAFARLWEREALLEGAVLLIEATGMEGPDAGRDDAISRLLGEIRGPLFLSTGTRRKSLNRALLVLEVGKPSAREQRDIWRRFLGSHAGRLNDEVEAIGAHFDLDAGTIASACAEALNCGGPAGDLGSVLWASSRSHARAAVNELAQRIVSAATWDDLVLPDAEKAVLREIAIHVRQRSKVYERWGFASAGSRGLGIGALFWGASGTGKTMAGEVLANELNLDLFRIDLSQVVNKYIGETEKNLKRIFDAADGGGAILLFDEADALFGKRSEVKDSHDRYANIEISYLLQRMEEYRGLAILTTNMKNSLDQSFLRRIRFVVQFPFPDQAMRAEIWRRAFPSQTPVQGLDFDQLARLQVPGGNIRNIALNAAFLAAESGGPVVMRHLLQAVRGEYAKLERPLTQAETGEWR